MKIKKDDMVNIISEDGSLNVRAKVVEVRGAAEVVLEPKEGSNLLKGSERIILSVPDTAYRAVIKGFDEDRIVVDIITEDRRKFFRIDDSLPVRVKKVNKRPSASRFLSVVPMKQGYRLPMDIDTKEDTIMAMLQEINQKLDYLINHLIIKQEGLPVDECQEVNLSASGMRVEIEEEVDIGDIVEVKMMLPLSPPVVIHTFGEVVRVKELEREGQVLFEVGLKFAELTEDVREEIIQYTLKKQREIIRRKREQL